MPELPEVETTKRGLEPWLLNQRIEKITVRQAKLRWPVPEEIFQLESQRIFKLERRAKYLLMHTEAGTAIWHLGMSGSLRVVEPNAVIGKHDHIDWQLSNEKVLRYHDPRKFGALLFNPPHSDVALLAQLGPEPLSDAFTGAYLFARARGKTQAVKTFIMDAHQVVGVGNIYANESLFKAGIHPELAAGKISLKRYEILAQEIKTILAQAIEQGGTTLRDFVGGDGKPGYFAQELRVYGRKGLPCPKCQKTLQEVRIAQRSSVFCTKCQH